MPKKPVTTEANNSPPDAEVRLWVFQLWCGPDGDVKDLLYVMSSREDTAWTKVWQNAPVGWSTFTASEMAMSHWAWKCPDAFFTLRPVEHDDLVDIIISGITAKRTPITDLRWVRENINIQLPGLQ